MSDLAIELKGVSKVYPFFALDNIDLEVPHGQIMGLIGPNGAASRPRYESCSDWCSRTSVKCESLDAACPPSRSQLNGTWDLRRKICGCTKG